MLSNSDLVTHLAFINILPLALTHVKLIKNYPRPMLSNFGLVTHLAFINILKNGPLALTHVKLVKNYLRPMNPTLINFYLVTHLAINILKNGPLALTHVTTLLL